MKNAAKKLVRSLVGNKFVWGVMDKTLLPFSRYADWMHQQITKKPDDEVEEIPDASLLNSDTILHGPFEGMVYKNDQFICSAIPPKLLGSYEREIHEWLYEILGKQFDGIIDVGCAEGYYAVGFAWKMKNARVYAYDINEQARQQCQKLAAANQVTNRVEIRTFCDQEELNKVVAGQRFLIISDCEGYEKQLFAESNIKSLAQSEILIEVHDFMDITILPYLRKLFSATHDIREIESIDDLRKMDRYQYPELEGRDINERYKIIAEWRKRIMIWMYITPKK